MKKVFSLLFILVVYINSIGQVDDLTVIEAVSNPLHLSNTGVIKFMDRNIPVDQVTEKDFLKSFPLSRKTSLNIRVFMANSITNYMHQLVPSVPVEQLVTMGNFQFAFFIDGVPIYRENIHHGCNYGAGGDKKTATTFRVPFTSTTGEDWWAMYLWDRFRLNGGDQVLTDGIHLLKVELRPYVRIPEDAAPGVSDRYVEQDLSNATIKVGHLVASGEVELVISTPVVTQAQMEIHPILPGSGWVISTAGLDKKKIEAMNAAIERYDLKAITSVVVVKNNQLLLEEYFNGANRSTLHDTRSAGKSFTSTLMGIAIHDGYIKNENQHIADFYNLGDFAHYSPAKDSIRVKDLLTMSSSFAGSDADSQSPGNEENMYPTDNWVKFTLDLPVDSSKSSGKQWDYFTAGVVLLGDVLDKKVPGKLEKYADEKLFRPLGIRNYKWQYTPQGVVNTAGSLQMRSIDYARYAQLYKNGGIWKGREILPAAWVKKTLSRQLPIPGRDQEFYGYLFWNKTYSINGKNYEAFYCAGNGGNEFIIFNDLPIIVIITSTAFNKPYGHPQAERIIEEFLLPAVL